VHKTLCRSGELESFHDFRLFKAGDINNWKACVHYKAQAEIASSRSLQIPVVIDGGKERKGN
jgi:hypothetical protein